MVLCLENIQKWNAFQSFCFSPIEFGQLCMLRETVGKQSENSYFMENVVRSP